MAENIYVNDYGHALIVTITENGAAVNVSTASAKTIDLVSPSGQKTSKAASFYSDGSDGKLVYTTVSGDLNESGTWTVQGSVTLGGGVFHGLMSTFTVNKLP